MYSTHIDPQVNQTNRCCPSGRPEEAGAIPLHRSGFAFNPADLALTLPLYPAQCRKGVEMDTVLILMLLSVVLLPIALVVFHGIRNNTPPEDALEWWD